MYDVATELLRGPRGRRLCLTYAAELNETLASAVFNFAHALDPNAGMRIWLVPNGNIVSFVVVEDRRKRTQEGV